MKHSWAAIQAYLSATASGDSYVHAAQCASAFLRAVSMSGVMINQVPLSWGGLPSKRHYLRHWANCRDVIVSVYRNYDVRSGSDSEVSRSHFDFRCWEKSGSRFRATGGPLVATSRHSRSPCLHCCCGCPWLPKERMGPQHSWKRSSHCANQ